MKNNLFKLFSILLFAFILTGCNSDSWINFDGQYYHVYKQEYGGVYKDVGKFKTLEQAKNFAGLLNR